MGTPETILINIAYLSLPLALLALLASIILGFFDKLNNRTVNVALSLSMLAFPLLLSVQASESTIELLPANTQKIISSGLICSYESCFTLPNDDRISRSYFAVSSALNKGGAFPYGK